MLFLLKLTNYFENYRISENCLKLLEIWGILAICTFRQFLSILTILAILGGVRMNSISNFLRGHSLKRIFRLVFVEIETGMAFFLYSYLFDPFLVQPTVLHNQK